MFFVYQIPNLGLNQNTRHYNVHLLWRKLLSFPAYLVGLDASRAFERVEYCKLFQLLIDSNMCPMFLRLFLYMYTHQKLR